ncbi:unnamed protein product [Mytilus coruscus]|uniref:Uncharacterized protein n=1 Tax=Mytilus coruscus TaxID=42192 RepID=A0A6J8B009_MYTCO|nr:unnamed protein product [Mytilus coruscus]
MADTGCQSFLAGIKVLHKIGLTKRDLIPVNMQIHAANNKGIVILGVFEGSGKTFRTHKTKKGKTKLSSAPGAEKNVLTENLSATPDELNDQDRDSHRIESPSFLMSIKDMRKQCYTHLIRNGRKLLNEMCHSKIAQKEATNRGESINFQMTKMNVFAWSA